MTRSERIEAGGPLSSIGRFPAGVLAGILVAGLCASAPARARSVIKKELSVPATGIESVTIVHPLGKLTVRGWDRPRVLMKAIKRGPDEVTARRLRVKGDVQNGQIRVETRVLMKAALPVGRRLHSRSLALRKQLRQLFAQPKPWSAKVREDIRRVQRALLGVYRAAAELSAGTKVASGRAVPIEGASLELTVYVPRRITVKATTRSGDIDVADLQGNVTLRSQQGRIFAHNVRGTLRTSSDRGRQFISKIRGPVDVDGYDGDLRLRSVRGAHVTARLLRGSISAREIQAPVVRFSTTEGGITLTATISRHGRLEVKTRRGDIDVRVRKSPRYRFRLRTKHGSIRLPGDAQLTRSTAGSRAGKRGQGGEGEARLDLLSVYGDVVLR